MGTIQTPKYDNDTVTFGYLKKYLEEQGVETTEGGDVVYKNYSSPPTPPYYKDSLLIVGNKIYRCTTQRLVGTFNWSDWALVSDGGELDNFIDSTYKTDLLEIEEQIDGKMESYYQDNDPSIEWATSLTKEKHVGDYWYNTTDNTQWRYTKNTDTTPISYGWKAVDIPSTVYDMIDNKKSIYTSKPTTYKKDDIWIIEDTLPDEDLPIGTEENPIAKGDWVFSIVDSETYDKSHWVRKDKNVNVEYLETHYYTTEVIDKRFEVVDSSIEANITQSKEDILLEVDTKYTTIETTNKIVKDYGETIDTITEEIKTNKEDIVSLNVEKDRITNRITSISKHIDEETGDITEVKTSTGFIFNEEGLEIVKDGKQTKTTVDEAGIEVQDSNNGTNEVQFYAGYVNDDIVSDEKELEDYKGQSVTYTNNVIFKKYLATGNGRMENVYNDQYGKGIGFFV